ncbi:tetratricopeptide repeat protein [Sulfuricurvum sp.]|uniref:tetratricopeptide repeat protein n=1 Tax=Sulfuricurvum sp. TaxID=2025608 RepID=UPI00262AD8D9|nr:tetratricopeptide repeat protein [Sulfuricurvum sp.]MDD4883468.1 tetratricopeptide repeat protein [Sulfuricurvum sp.]
MHRLILSALFFFLPFSLLANSSVDKSRALNNKNISAVRLQTHDSNDSSIFVEKGLMSELGNGMEKNATLAYNYYTKAVALGNIEAYYHLGRFYHTPPVSNERLFKKDINASIRYYGYAADRGYVRAQHNLAYLYFSEGLPYKDDNKSFYYAQKAADQNFTMSQYLLANFYAIGIGTVKNPTKAVELYKTVLLKEDNGRAQYNLALLIASGMGHEVNNILAYALWYDNAKRGDADSAYNIEKLKKRMTPEEIKLAEELSKNRQKMINQVTPMSLKKLL